MPKNSPLSTLHFPFILAALLFLMAAPPTSAQLADTLGAMSIGAEMDANAAQAATKEAPKPATENIEEDVVENTAPAPAATSGDILRDGWWGPGGYFSPIKLPLFILIFLFWTGTASWMNADIERLQRPGRETVNAGYLGLFLGLGGALFFVPIFWVAFPAWVLLWLVPALVYVVKRNSTLPLLNGCVSCGNRWPWPVLRGTTRRYAVLHGGCRTCTGRGITFGSRISATFSK